MIELYGANAVADGSRLLAGNFILARREHLHILGGNLYLSACAAILLLDGAVVYLSLHIELVARVYILFYYLGQFAPEDYIMPGGAVGYLTAGSGLVASLGGGKPKIGHAEPFVNILDLGFLAHVAYQHHFVHRRYRYRLTFFAKLANYLLVAKLRGSNFFHTSSNGRGRAQESTSPAVIHWPSRLHEASAN